MLVCASLSCNAGSLACFNKCKKKKSLRFLLSFSLYLLCDPMNDTCSELYFCRTTSWGLKEVTRKLLDKVHTPVFKDAVMFL